VDLTLKLYEEALGMARTPDEKKLVLAGLAEVKDERAIKLIDPLTSDEQLKAEATQAIDQIKKNLPQK
jgi:hypothetical protein